MGTHVHGDVSNRNVLVNSRIRGSNASGYGVIGSVYSTDHRAPGKRSLELGDRSITLPIPGGYSLLMLTLSTPKRTLLS